MGEDLRPAQPERNEEQQSPNALLQELLDNKPASNDRTQDTPARPSPFGDGPGKMNPGKMNPGGADTPQEKVDRKDAVDSSSKSAKDGDFNKLQDTLKNAFEKMGGDPNKFEKFGKELADQLAKEGITVKPGKGSIAFHKDGSPDGVEFKMDGNLDPKTGKVVGEAKAQAYDWVTKHDTDKKASEVINQLGQKDAKPGQGQLKDSRELGSGFDEAYQKNDFTQYNKDLQASFAHAYKAGGMDAVRKLELAANDPAKGGAQTEGAGPVAIEENGKLKIYNAEGLPPGEAKLAKVMTPEQLSQAGIIKHESFGYFKIKDAGPPAIPMTAEATVGGKKK